MAHFSHLNIGFNIVPPLPVDSKVSIAHNHEKLFVLGFNMPVIITNVPLDKDVSQSKSALVIAHFDTGASVTSIDEKLADELELFPIGRSSMQTAGGLKETKKYMVNISFPNTALKDYKLSVNDCNLPYNGIMSDLSPQNFSVLLGRDIMTNWNIVWNGPTSTVLVSD